MSKANDKLTTTGWPGEDPWGKSGAIAPVQAFEGVVFAFGEEPELLELTDVEIFRVGKWNGDDYNEADLDEMVTNFEHVGFRPPIKLGHAEKSGDPAFGWVRSIKRQGDRLVASFMDLPRTVFDAIQRRGFDAVSSEIFWNLKRGDKTFRRALKAVALLGAETPAVSNLKPLRESFTDEDLSLVHVYALPGYTDTDEEKSMTDAEKKAIEDLKSELAATKKHSEELAAKLKAAPKKTEEGDLAIKLNAMREEIETLKKSKGEIEEVTRKERIEAKCASLKVPAFRSHVHALYDLATRAYAQEDLRAVKFAIADDDGKMVARDTDPVKVIDDLVSGINKVMDSVFLHQHSDRIDHNAFGLDGEQDEGRDPGIVVDEKARAYMASNKVDDYQVALHAVLADPENKQVATAYINRGGRAN